MIPCIGILEKVKQMCSLRYPRSCLCEAGMIDRKGHKWENLPTDMF
jgi:hypothetical protein